MKKNIKLILALIIFLYEELFLIPAKKVLSYFKNIIFYDQIILFFSRSIYLTFAFVLIIGFLAESCAIFAGYLMLKHLVFLAVLFYFLKIILFVPLIDVFKQNKQELLRFQIIKIIYFYYLKLKRLKIWNKIRKIKKTIKSFIKEEFTKIKKLIEKRI